MAGAFGRNTEGNISEFEGIEREMQNGIFIFGRNRQLYEGEYM